MAIKLSVHWPSVAYATTSAASGMMGSVFFFYYVKVFLNMYKVSESWFQASQVVFMIWNAVNDPLFGYIQDKGSWDCVKSRRHSILYGAIFYSISFLVPWFPWMDYEAGSWVIGVHLMASLCFYDTLLTFVLLAQSALFTEMSSKQEDRIQLVRYSQVASLCGSTTVFFCDYFSDNLKNFHHFQMVCVVIAVLAYFLMVYSGKYADTKYELKATKHDEHTVDPGMSNVSPSIPDDIGVLRLTWQIICERNFLCFVAVNFCTIFETTFVANFVVILVENLLPTGLLSSTARSIYFGVLFIAPQLTVISLTPLVSRLGSYHVIRWSIILRMVVGVVMYMLGRHQYMAMLLYFMLVKGLGKSTFSYFNMTVSDIIDADTRKYRRKHPVSSSVFGINALITKPAHSFAPMFAVAVFNRYGYEQLRDKSLTDPAEISMLYDTMFGVMCAIPVIMGAVELLTWSRYTLQNTHREEASSAKNT